MSPGPGRAMKLATRLSLTLYLTLGLMAACAAMLFAVSAAQDEALRREQTMQQMLIRTQELLPAVAAGRPLGWEATAARLAAAIARLELPPATRAALQPAIAELRRPDIDTPGMVRCLSAIARGMSEARDAAHAQFTRESIALGQLLILFNLLLILSLLANTSVLRRAVLQPLDALRHGVEQLASGRFEHRISLERRDELGELAAAFNAMAARLHDSSVSLVRDNFARARAVEEVARSEERWRQLAAASFEGIMVVVDGRVVDANDQMARLFACAPGELLGRAAGELLLPVADDGAFSAAAAAGDVARGRVRRAAGEERLVEVRQMDGMTHRGQAARIMVLRDITDAEWLRRRLLDALTYAHDVIAASPLGIMVFTIDGRCVTANAAAAEITGVAGQAQLERAGSAALAPTLRRRLQVLGRRALRRGHGLRHDLHYLNAAGAAQWLDVRAVPLRQGGQDHLMLILEDSTARRNMLHALNESETRFRALVEHVPAVTYLTKLDMPGMILYVSPQIEGLLGCTPGEFRDNPQAWHDWLHPDDRNLALDRRVVHKANGSQPLATEYRMVSRTGRTVWVRDEAAIICADDGEPLFLQGLLHDVTAWKELEHKLQRAYAVLEETTDLVLMLDRDCLAFYLNRAARQFCALPDSEAATAKPLTELFAAASAAELQGRILPVAQREGVWSGETVMRRRDGSELPVLLVVQAHRADSEHDSYYALTARDVTILKRLAEARAETTATRAVIDAQADGLLVVAMDGTVTAANPAFAELTGIAAGTFTGQPLPAVIERVVAPADRAGAHAMARLLAAGQTSQPLAMNLNRDAGRLIPVLATAAFIRDAGGAPGAAVITFKDISSIRAAEARRRESEALAQAIIDANRRDAVFLLAPEGRILAGNQTLADSFHLPLKEIIGRGYATLMPAAIAAARLACVRQVVATGLPQQLEDTRAGLVLSHSFYPVCDSNGRVFQVAVVSRNVTAQRQAEEKLRQLAAGLAEAQRIARLGSWEWDIVTGEESWSDEAYRIFGLTPGELQPDFNVFLSFVHPDDRARVEQVSRAAIEQGQPYDIIHRIVQRNGEVRVVREQAEVLRDAAGRPLRKTGTMMDITEAEQARQDLRVSEERYRSLFESSADGIFFADMSGCLRDANRAFLAITGSPDGDFQAQCLMWHNLIPAAWQAAEAAVRRDELLPHGQTNEFELAFNRQGGGTVPVSLRLWLIRDANGQPAGTWGIVRDITARKEAERQVQAAIAEIEHSNRELEQFAYVASHDLQEPLTVIAGYVGLLAHRYRDSLDDKAARYIDFTTESVERMQAMIQGLLQYSRIGQGARDEAVALNAVFDEVLQNLAAAISRSGATVTRGELPVLPARKFELLRLLQNLIENALKYRAPERAPVVRVTAEYRDGFWVLAVADNGQGVPARHRERIFQIFQRLHTGEEYQGTGIGLAICKKVVEKYGGSFTVEDNPGGGTVFRFTLAAEPGPGR